jgi:hypothetical protein
MVKTEWQAEIQVPKTDLEVTGQACVGSGEPSYLVTFRSHSKAALEEVLKQAQEQISAALDELASK